MNVYTRVSDKGQVVVPKSTRDRLGWRSGTELEVVESSDAVTFRRRSSAGTISADEALVRLRALYRHAGPIVPVDRLSWSPDGDDPAS